jgi:NAD(P)-dependent dehydrogenase (short-subunit alcohol dehydrogenase family)
MRLEDKVAIVVGAGQTPGETIGNGRATALLYAREGARVLAVDVNLASAEETVALISEEGGEAFALRADVTDESSVRDAIHACVERWKRVDVLHNNVGVSRTAGDTTVSQITIEAFDRVVAINLRGIVLACKHTLPVMREQESGVIINISSVAARAAYPRVGYKTTKAAVIALTEQLAITNAGYGIRANAILPGLMNTPMAIEPQVAATGLSREEVVSQRDAGVPLRGGMGTAWDVAYAALFLASDEARFITGVSLPVDGGTLARVG